MKCICFMMIEAMTATRSEWWRHAEFPEKLRKGNPGDLGYMYRESKDSRWRWMPKAEFELQYDVCR